MTWTTNLNESEINTIIKDCFWDYDYTVEDINKIISGNNKEQKVYLLKKIITNSTDFFRLAKKMFERTELENILKQIPYGSFKYEFQNIRIAALRNFYLGENNAPKRLRWPLS